MEFYEKLGFSEREDALLLFLGQEQQGKEYATIGTRTIKELSDIYDLLIQKGLIKIVGSDTLEGWTFDKVELTPEGTKMYLNLEARFEVINNLVRGMVE